MTDSQDYIRPYIPIPGPQYFDRYLNTDLLADVGDADPGPQYFDRYLNTYLYADVGDSFLPGQCESLNISTAFLSAPPVSQFSLAVAVITPTDLLSNSISVSLSHA